MSEIKKQQRCKYCHEPFLDFSGRTDYEVNLDDAAYCSTDDKGNLELGRKSKKLGEIYALKT